MKLLNPLISKIMIARRNLKRSFQIIYVSLFNGFIKNDPNFLCIGAPKAATTWLHERLMRHNEVFLPEDKELHFFDDPYLPEGGEIDKKQGFGYYKPFDMNSKIHWRWYRFQFRFSGNKVKGDITPTYARISEDKIKLIAEKIPGIKIIYILRNPIERAWSGASYFMHRWHGRGMAELDGEDSLIDWVMEPERIDHGHYMQKIELWEKHIPSNNIKYILYDDICTNPGLVLAEICDFLCISKEMLPNSDGDKSRVNSAYPKMAVPENVQRALRDEYFTQIKWLEKKFNRDLSEWLG